MIGFGLTGLSALLTGVVSIIGTEIYSLIKSKMGTTDPAKTWTIADKWLEAHYPIADLIFRIATVILLGYITFRVAASVP
jgi:hypothetical protein